MALSRVHATSASHTRATSFAGRENSTHASSVAKYALSPSGMSAKKAATIIKDECLLDGNPTMNLASFVTTWMEDEADEILLMGRAKNIADQEQYPASNEIQERCVNILAKLFHAPRTGAADASHRDSASPVSPSQEEQECGLKPPPENAVGTSTIGSSEAIMLAALAMKWRWRQWRARKAQEAEAKREQAQHAVHDSAGDDVGGNKVQSNEKDSDANAGETSGSKATPHKLLKGEGWATSAALSGRAYGPGSGEPACNLVISAASHVSMLKACKYLDIQPRIIALAPGRYTLDPELVMQHVDENTIGVMTILGNTLTGAFDPIEAINDLLVAYNAAHGTDVSMHVDAASGGFTVPFSHPGFRWDFRLDRVRSINVSGHKYGGVFAGVGWIVWKSKPDLPEDLVFHVNYLGADEPTYGINFSKPAAQVLLQYFVFLRLGEEGFKRIITQCISNAKYLASQLERTGIVEIISENLSPGGHTIPLVVWRLKPDARTRRLLGFDERELVHELRTRGWIIPAYSLAADCEKMVVIRCVIRECMSEETADLLLHDIKTKVVDLMKGAAKKKRAILREMRRAANLKGAAEAGKDDQQGAEDDDENADSEPDEDDEAREALAAHILGVIQPVRPHTRMGSSQRHHRGLKDGAGGEPHSIVDGVVGAVKAGLNKVGLGSTTGTGDMSGASSEHVAAVPAASTSSSSASAPTRVRDRLSAAVHGKASSVHTGSAGSAKGGKTQHITSVLC